MLREDADRLAPIPQWALRALARAEALDPEREFLPSAEEMGAGGVKHGLLNVYPPDDGVAAHTDDPLTWTGWVLGLSLGSDVVMVFRSDPRRGAASGSSCFGSGGGVGNLLANVHLPRRSLYVLTGAARWELQHEIERQKFDYIGGSVRWRETRVSMTLRGINPAMLPPSERARDEKEVSREREKSREEEQQEQQK